MIQSQLAMPTHCRCEPMLRSDDASPFLRRSRMTRCARSRHVLTTSAAPLPCRLSLSTIRVGGDLLAREQRRLAAIATADVVGCSHAAYEQIYHSSLMPRSYLCARLLETLD